MYGTVSDQHLYLMYVLATNMMVRDLKAIRFIKIGSNPVDYAKPRSVKLHSQGAYLPIWNYLRITVYIFDSSTIKKTATTLFAISLETTMCWLLLINTIHSYSFYTFNGGTH